MGSNVNNKDLTPLIFENNLRAVDFLLSAISITILTLQYDNSDISIS